VTLRWPVRQEVVESTSSLWAYMDGGDTWRPMSALQRIVPDQVLTAFGVKSANATDDHPLYLYVASHVPSRLLYLKVAQIVDDRHWAYLPPLPAQRTSADRAGITSILGAAASGKLQAFGVSPQTGIQTDTPLEEPFDQQWLWSWDPHARRWTSLGPPLPVTWKWCGDGCWRASLAQSATSQQTVLWVHGYVSESGDNEVYRLSLPTEV